MSGRMDPVSLHHCVLPTHPNPLISETLDKLLLQEGKGSRRVREWQEGLRSSIEKEELFLMQYTDVSKLWALQVMD